MHFQQLNPIPKILLMINNKGSASVFLIFLLVILVGSIGILLEGSRYRGFQVCTKGMADTAGKAVMTEYYRPLYDDYHVFFLAFAQGEEKEHYIQTRIKEYADYTLEPRKGREFFKKSTYGRAFHIPDSYKIKVTNLCTALQEDGKHFEEEAVSYIKYKSLTILAQKLRGTLDTVNNLYSSSKAMEEKMKCEEVLGRNAEGTLRLMELVDGITVDEKGSVKVRSNFIKKLVPGPVTMNNVGVNNNELWIKQKNKFIDVNQLLQSMKRVASKVDVLLSEQERLIEERCDIKSRGKKEECETLEELDTRLSKISEEISEEVEKIKERRTLFLTLIKEVDKKTKEAIMVIEELNRNTQKVQMQVKRYREYLESVSGEVEGDLKASMEADAREMETITSTGLDLKEVSRILEKNKDILQNLNRLGNEKISASHQNLQQIMRTVDDNLNALSEYSIGTIVFSYGSSNKSSVENPICKMKELMCASILELVLPEDKEISKKHLSEEIIAGTMNHSETKRELQHIVKSIQELQGVGEWFHNLGDGKEISPNEVDNLTSRVLFLFYQEEHFGSFIRDNSKKDCKLDYELEYILQGNSEDKMNLQEIVGQMLICKMAFNFIGVFTDPQKRQLVKETAIALAGITGIEPLIHITETIISLVWALDEALVDVAGLLQNKESQIIKKGSQFCITYKELLLINKELIQQKATSLSEKQRGGICYQSFLKIMLLIKDNQISRLRSMEIINHNMILRNKDKFLFENCVQGFKLRIKAKMKSKFLFFQAGKRTIEQESLTWVYQAELEQSY